MNIRKYQRICIVGGAFHGLRWGFIMYTG